VIEYSSRNTRNDAEVEVTITNELSTSSDSQNYWYWSSAEKQQDTCFSVTEIERKLQKDANCRIKKQREAESVDYWTWENPAEINSKAKLEQKQVDYWTWESQDQSSENVLDTEHIVQNLIKQQEQEEVSLSRNDASDDYWSWESSKVRLDRIKKNQSRPQHLLLVNEIEEKLVSDAAIKAEKKEMSHRHELSDKDVYWNWDSRLLSHSSIMKNAETNVLSTDAMIVRLVDAANAMELARNQSREEQSYWSWNNSNDYVLSSDAIERQLINGIEQNKLETKSNEFWAWEGVQSSFEAGNVANNTCAAPTAMSEEESQKYWVM